MAKREAVSKKTRFEVFKRDQFKCQYCGASAPEVILVVDHIKPVAGGGTRDILNLITACEGCNAGKSDIPLSDSAAVKKQLNQVRALADRREQMGMLVAWRDSLQDLEKEKQEILITRVNARLAHWDHHLNESGKDRVRTWVRKFGLDSSLYGIDQANETDPAAIINQMEQFSAAAAKIAKEPQLRDFWRIRLRLRTRRFRYGPEWKPIQDMRVAFKDGVTIEEMDGAATEATNYDHFMRLLGYTNYTS